MIFSYISKVIMEGKSARTVTMSKAIILLNGPFFYDTKGQCWYSLHLIISSVFHSE